MVNLSAILLSHNKNSRAESPVSLRDRLLAVTWQTHAGWLGLCCGLAVTLFVTSGLKDLIGKPRPDMLARCDPDLSNINKYVVGGFGVNLDSEAPPFVTSAICQQPDKRLLDDGFAAFPSGHSSFSSAGMVYLTLWLCARWSIAIPLLQRSSGYRDSKQRKRSNSAEAQVAPPLWQAAIAFTPIFVALFVCASRYADFHHAGFDIIAGAVIGTVFGWASFRLYHLPIRRSKHAMAWGPRNHQNPFLAYSRNDLESYDEEPGRRSMGTELDYLGVDAPTRTDTAGSHQPILQNPAYRPQQQTNISRDVRV